MGDGAHRWLTEAAACGAQRIRLKMAAWSSSPPSAAPAGSTRHSGWSRSSAGFADGDLASIIDHLAAEREAGEVVTADEAHSAQPGTAGWARLGTQEAGR